MPKPPFRADQVGSLLRPPELRDAHERNLKGELDRVALRAIEDRHIRAAVALQEAVGLEAVTDGEFRRTSFHFDFLEQLDGVKGNMPLQVGPEAAPTGVSKAFAPPTLDITGPVRHVRPIEVDGFAFLKSVTTRVAKQTIPSPTMLLRGERSALAGIYPDRDAFYADIAAAYRAEIAALAAAGCTYLQLDDTNFAYLCDAQMRAAASARGDDPDATLRRYAELINATLADRPSGMTVCVHVCRGNLQSRWAASGGYEPVAEVLFRDVAVDGYFLEYDSDRAGGFEPLRFLPEGKRAVLGLVSSKLPAIETQEAIRYRIDEAARFAPLDQLCLSPQCGFASSYRGNAVAEDVERAKLRLVVETAAAVWPGTA
jgi:5-methyltetrahydropteroyltriglutamate--homocysteine methyltransferase